MTFDVSLFLIIAAAYLLGSVPFGLILARLAGAGDIRKIGSGNIGATNVLRTGKKGLALLTLLLDGGKGLAAVFVAAFFAPESVPFAGVAALAGHIFPVWLGFKGGKGVATSLGILFGTAWPVGVFVAWIWLMVVLASRYSSLGAIVATLFVAPACFMFGYPNLLGMAVAVTVLVLYKHSPNIRRLLSGTEPKIGQKNDDTATDS